MYAEKDSLPAFIVAMYIILFSYSSVWLLPHHHYTPSLHFDIDTATARASVYNMSSVSQLKHAWMVMNNVLWNAFTVGIGC